MIENFDYKLIGKKELEEQNPYVVSEDIGILLQKWAKEKKFNLPDKEFFVQLRLEFALFMTQIFPKFESINESELSEGLGKLVEKTGLYPISLDRVYYQSESRLDISRLVNVEGNDRGLGRRRDSPTLLNQFRKLKGIGIKEAVLVDDVLFSGDLAKRIIDILSNVGIKVPIICAGVVIKEGMETLSGFGKEIRAVIIYGKVIDEICERDFYPGVPLCGRSLNNKENIGTPYILPFGNPGKWASIPEKWQKSISQFCLKQSIKLFEEIENCSGRYVYCSDLDRKVISLPKDQTRFADCLKQSLQQI